MKLARGLERRLENLVDGASASVFKGKMHPVVIGGKMLRQLDFQTEDSVAGPQIPNDLVVTLNPLDLDVPRTKVNAEWQRAFFAE